jgi:HD-GYP domain-containing protein (c-di-GMP phosphodiesterase class II)
LLVQFKNSNKNFFEDLVEFIKKDGLNIPIIAVGDLEVYYKNLLIVQGTYNIQSIIRGAAKILNITAKEMAELEVPKYYPIEIKTFTFLKFAPVSLFLEIKKDDEKINYVKLANKGDSVEGILKRLEKEKIENIFVFSNERLAMVNCLSQILSEEIKNAHNLSNEDKKEVLDRGFDFFISQFFGPETSLEIIDLGKNCVSLVEEIVGEAPNLRSILKMFVSNKNNYGYKHSMIAAYVASHLIKNVPWGGSSHIEKINFVLFFHDIYLVPILNKYPHLKIEEDLLFNSELSVKEKEIVLNHARLSAEFVVTLKKCPMGVDLLIKQHHGMVNGTGFAIDFKDDISPLSKVIIIAEAFVTELIAFEGKEGMAAEFLPQIVMKLNEKFKRNTYTKIIKYLETLRL